MHPLQLQIVKNSAAFDDPPMVGRACRPTRSIGSDTDHSALLRLQAQPGQMVEPSPGLAWADRSRDLAIPQPPLFSFPVVQTPASRALHAGAPLSKLTAVMAPIGYGKTVLLSELFQNGPRWHPSAWWFGLDDRDVTIERFLEWLEVKLDASEERIALTDAAVAMQQGGEPDSERIKRVIGRLRRWPSPLALFIDNLNYCHDPALGEFLEQLVFETPPWVCLICSSTEALPVDLVRCKLQGLLAEYGIAELSLDVAGVREVLGAELCARLPPDSVWAIMEQTEGWPAAVRLMQILLSSSRDPERTLAGFISLDGDVATFLNAQVLKEFDPDLRSFLLELSLLRDFDATLAIEATGDAAADVHLRYLWAHNVFLIPVDGECRYRLHNLFRQFLCAQAVREIPERRRKEVLERAALCCERELRCADAIDYALSGGSTRLAAEILERTAPVFVRDLGYLRRYLEWIGHLHAAGEYGGWEADYWYVWALVFRRRYGQAREEVVRLGDRLAKITPDEARQIKNFAAIARRIEIIRITLGIYTDRMREAEQSADRWLVMSDLEGGDQVDSPFDVATVASAAAIANTEACHLLEARRLVRIAFASIAQSESAYGHGWVAAVNALISLREGDYVGVYAGVMDAISRARRELGENAAICGTLSLLGAKAAVEMDLRDEARELLNRGIQQISTHGVLDTAAYGLDAAIKLWSGQDDDTLSLAALRGIAAAYPPRLSLMLSCFLVRRYIQLGRLDDARQEAAILGINDHYDADLCSRMQEEYGAALRDLIHAVQVELSLAAGRLKLAGKLIAEEVVRTRGEGRAGRMVELALDEAFLSQCMMHSAVPAARYLTRAISLASRWRNLRPFRDQRDLIAGLVNDTRLKDWSFVSEEERRFFAEVCCGLKVGNPILDQLQEMEGAQSLADGPTARELELLSLIEAGLSNQEIADRLSLSVSTVKWHLYNLYAKLGVKNRAAALARARSLNLLQW